jgi:phage terminase large subunit
LPRLRDIDLREGVIPKFAPGLGATERYLVLYGGAGSGKSVFASQKVILRCIAGPQRILVIRRVARTLRRSVFAEIKARLSEWGLYRTTKINATEMTVTFPNGSEILFAGVDDVEKLKSISGITSIWIEEATELSEEDFTQIDLRLRGETEHYKQIILTFNPISHMHWLKRRFFDSIGMGDKGEPGSFTDAAPGTFVYAAQSTGVRVIKSTYLDNPFVDDQYKALFEDLKRRSPSLYRVYGEGEWGVLKGLIFKPPEVVAEFPERFDMEAYGIDFGFNNPTTIIHVGFKDVDWTRRAGSLFVRELLYESGLSNAELGDKMRALGIERRTPVYADAAEPARIKELARHGFNIHPAAKGKNSVATSIALLQSFMVYTTPESTNLIAEMATYSWEEDKNGNMLDKPVPLNDHAIDALRYAVWSTMKKRVRKIEVR